MKNFFTLLLFLSFNLFYSQCPTSNIVLSGQDDIDNFPVNYPNCHVLEHSISIRGFEVTNIDSLYSIQRINSSLYLEGLEDIQNYDGLNNLTYVENFKMRINRSPLEISGFQSLDSIQVDFSINDTHFATGISGFDNLKYVGGDFGFGECEGLEHISGFNQLKYVGESVRIVYADNLVDFLGLANLETVGEGVLLRDLNNLENLDGFASLKDFDTHITIIRCPDLTDISGLDSLSLDIGNQTRIISITDNQSLSVCNTYFLCQALNIDNYSLHVQSNAGGCFYYDDLEGSCAAMSVHNISKEEFNIYPNPVEKTLFIDYSFPINDIRIYSSEGKLIKTSRNTEIDISELLSGVYFIRIWTDDNWIERKFIKN